MGSATFERINPWVCQIVSATQSIQMSLTSVLSAGLTTNQSLLQRRMNRPENLHHLGTARDCSLPCSPAPGGHPSNSVFLGRAQCSLVLVRVAAETKSTTHSRKMEVCCLPVLEAGTRDPSVSKDSKPFQDTWKETAFVLTAP